MKKWLFYASEVSSRLIKKILKKIWIFSSPRFKIQSKLFQFNDRKIEARCESVISRLGRLKLLHTHPFTISWTICWTNTSGKHLEIGNRLRGPFYAPSINSILFLRYRVYSPISRLLVFAFCAPLRKNFFLWKIINNPPSNIYIYIHTLEKVSSLWVTTRDDGETTTLQQRGARISN